MAKARILIADDEKSITVSLRNVLTDLGFSVETANNAQQFFHLHEQFRPDICVLDIYLGADNGIEILKNLRLNGIQNPIILMTAHSDVALAVQAMKEGASDFVVKPFDINHLVLLIEKNIEFHTLESKVKFLQAEIEEQRSKSGIVGKSAKLKAAMDIADKLAHGETTTVLLEGESGTGKELFARFIHQQSTRAEKPFITVNCGAIPKDLAESEFFGYEKGAFTGATERMKQGKFELASGGTILLDEIGELSLDMQVKLLRVLEERKYFRLGGTREIVIDVRVIAATNRNLAKEVEAGRFREDLFYRLNVASIKIPTLRERKEDIPQLAQSFISEFSKRFNKDEPKLSIEAQEFLKLLPWKGNVRELKNAMERVVLLHNVAVLQPDHFKFLRANQLNGKKGAAGDFVLEIPPEGVKMKDVLRELILKTLEITQGNQVQAAKVLGVTRSKLRYRMELLGIRPEQRSFLIANE